MDHVAKALEYLEMCEKGAPSLSPEAAVILLSVMAQTHATLALVRATEAQTEYEDVRFEEVKPA